VKDQWLACAGFQFFFVPSRRHFHLLLHTEERARTRVNGNMSGAIIHTEKDFSINAFNMM